MSATSDEINNGDFVSDSLAALVNNAVMALDAVLDDIPPVNIVKEDITGNGKDKVENESDLLNRCEFNIDNQKETG
eukprot:6498198-Ditylum_brightwellii.AAC.1